MHNATGAGLKIAEGNCRRCPTRLLYCPWISPTSKGNYCFALLVQLPSVPFQYFLCSVVCMHLFVLYWQPRRPVLLNPLPTWLQVNSRQSSRMVNGGNELFKAQKGILYIVQVTHWLGMQLFLLLYIFTCFNSTPERKKESVKCLYLWRKCLDTL